MIIIVMETATNYKFYSFQQIPQPNFDAAMAELAAKFQQALKSNLAKVVESPTGNKPK